MKAGMLVAALFIVFGVFLFLLGDGDLLFAFFPVLFVSMMILGMRAIPASGMELILGMGLGITLQIAMYFVIGAIIGSILQNMQNKYAKWGVIFMALLCVPVIILKVKGH